MSVKLIVMGVGGVGKSAITNRFVINRWIEKYDPTIEESYMTNVDIDGKALQVEILDTAGQDEYAPLRETFMHTGDGFIFVYSLTDDQTLEELRAIREQVLNVHPNRKVPIILVANKLDMAAEDRAVSQDEGEAMADEINAIAFMEVSAKQNVGVKQAFETLLKKIVTNDAQAGVGEGSGSVFGGGRIDNSEQDLADVKSNLDSFNGATKRRTSKIYNPITSKRSMCNLL